MKNKSQIILLKSSDNTSSIRAVVNFHKKDEKILLLANSKVSLLKESLEELQEKMPNFKTLYTHVTCMLLKDKLSVLEKINNTYSFIDELENLMKKDEFTTIYFHRTDTLLNCIAKHECEYIISKIIHLVRIYNKKVVFSINSKTEFGQLLESILSDKVTHNYNIEYKSKENKSKLILINASDNKELVKSTFNLLKENENMLFLADENSVLLSHIFKEFKKEIKDFNDLYKRINCYTLRAKWCTLDKIYEKPIFLHDIQEMMRDESHTTIYFHRIDKLFKGASKEDLETLISDIKELSCNYQKKALFSINSDTKAGKILEPVLRKIVDYEYMIEQNDMKKAALIPANLSLGTKKQNRGIG